jgi:hypothetical protein
MTRAQPGKHPDRPENSGGDERSDDDRVCPSLVGALDNSENECDCRHGQESRTQWIERRN